MSRSSRIILAAKLKFQCYEITSRARLGSLLNQKSIAASVEIASYFGGDVEFTCRVTPKRLVHAVSRRVADGPPRGFGALCGGDICPVDHVAGCREGQKVDTDCPPQ